jgi:hypothetical protein
LVDLATRARDRFGASLRWLEVGDAALSRKPDWWQDWQPPRAAGGPPRSAIVPRSWKQSGGAGRRPWSPPSILDEL